jgi:RNA polymerase sigma-70 factor, ECF subfamily
METVGREVPIRMPQSRHVASVLVSCRAALDVPRPLAAVPAGGAAGPSGGHGMGPATQQMLGSLRALLSVAEGAEPLSGDRASRAGFAPGSAPQDFERVSALVELAQRGDAEAFGLLYERYVDVVYRYIYVRVGSAHLAEDLTSETFLRALRRMDSFSWQGRDIAAWFITIARNLITDNAKSARFRMEVTTADMLDADQRVDAPDTEVLQRLRDTRLLEAVKGLKPEQAECVVLRFLQGLSLAETAKVLGKTEGAVKQLQLRAVRALHRELADVEL